MTRDATAVARVRLVAWHAFKEHVRDRVLYGIGGFALLLVAASVLIGQITAGQDLKIIKDLGLAAIELSGVLIAIFIGVGLVSREIERRTIYAVLAKPLARWEFIVGKYVGLVITLAVNVAAMSIALYVVLGLMRVTTPAAVRLGWEAPALDPRLLVAISLIFVELALITALALFFSTFSSSALLSVVFTVGLWVAGLFNADLRGLGTSVSSPVLARAAAWLASVLPAFSAFDVKAQVVHALPVPAGFVWMTSAYGAAYATALIAGAVVVFSRREFK